MAKFSSRICSGSSVLLLLLLCMGASSQDKSGEFKHDLPEGVELVDPKSLGLTDADLGKFLGNVKVLGGGQVGDTKTQILTVGFNGDESINFNDFTIPGLTDGNNTLPVKDKEIADMAFQQFKQFFQDPNKAKQFEDAQGKLNLPFQTQNHNDQNKHRLQTPPNNPQNIHNNNHPPQLRIPMIQKPYTTPRPQFAVPSHVTNHPFLNPPPPPPPQRQVNHQHQPQQKQQPHQNSFNQYQPQEQHLEFGARIPTANTRPAPPPPPPPPTPQQQQFHRQQDNRFTKPAQHQLQAFQRPPPQQAPPPPPQLQQIVQPNFQQNFQQPQRNPNQQFFTVPQTSQIRFPTNEPPLQQSQFPIGLNPPPPQVSFLRFNPQPVAQNNIQQPATQNFIPPQQSHHQPPPNQNQIVQQPFPAAPREQGKIVRNQLLLLNENNHNSNSDQFYNGPSKGLTPPPPPLSYQSAQSATNQVPVQSPPPYDANNQLPTASATATSSVYIHHRGPKSSKVQHTSFHPQFRPPTRFAKDFTPIPAQSTTTIRPHSFEVTPSMTLIPLSTNENAITDPQRTMQLRLYQQQKAQASNALLTQAAPPSPPTATPISITTSFPDTSDSNQFQSSFYDFNGAQEQSQFSSQNNEIASQVVDNEIYNNAPFSQQQSQHQLHFLQQQPQQLQQQQSQQFQESNQPTVFYTQDNGRAPHQGTPPRFQVNFSHELGKGTRFQMHPDPQNIFNNIRKKRGYRRLSNLFNRMFRWDRH